MRMSSKTSGPPSGWYPEHPGSQTYRLWDGEQWTHYTQDAANDPPPVTLTAGPETPATNVFIWLLALLPIASAIGVLPWDIHAYLAAHTTVDRASVLALDPTQQALQITNVLVYIASVILGYADYRRLGQKRFARRFHWAWGFLGSAVYMIGRSVVVYAQTRRGLIVLWIFIASNALIFAVVIAKVVTAAATLGPALHTR